MYSQSKKPLVLLLIVIMLAVNVLADLVNSASGLKVHAQDPGLDTEIVKSDGEIAQDISEQHTDSYVVPVLGIIPEYFNVSILSGKSYSFISCISFDVHLPPPKAGLL